MKRSALLAAVLMAAGLAASDAAAAVTQPSQPTSGPGGSDYSHGGVRVTQRSSGNDAWYLFEPTRPGPVSAPLAIVTHGYGEFSGYSTLSALIRHTVRKGNVVIYPRWQTGVASPCPGPFDIEPCLATAADGIRGALEYLRARRSRVQPQLERASYFGFSFGGIITSNLTNRYRRFALPRPRAIFLDDPHDGGLTGGDEPALDDSLAGIPSSTLVQCHTGADSAGMPHGPEATCNAVLPKLSSIPARNKDAVLTSDDGHGEPALGSEHGVCETNSIPGADSGPADAYDWAFCWKSWDALRSCAYAGVNCRFALGDIPEHRHIGTWSDGVPIIGLKVQDTVPIGPQPVPARQPAPTTRPTIDRRPRGRLSRVVRRRGKPVRFRGRASDDHRLALVQVAVVRRRGRRCRQMTRTGRFARLRRCGRPTSFLRASGRRRWSLRLRRPLRRGAYRVFVLVTDSAGQQQRRTSSRRFRVR